MKKDQLRNWCDESWPELYRYIYGKVSNREEAEDITQEAYARTLPKFPSGENLPSKGYLKTVALNILRDRWRQKNTSGTMVQLEEALLSGEDQDQVLDGSCVRELMDRLSPEHRTVLQLRIIEGFSRAETARKMSRSEDSVRGLQYRAIQNLRELFMEYLREVDES